MSVGHWDCSPNRFPQVGQGLLTILHVVEKISRPIGVGFDIPIVEPVNATDAHLGQLAHELVKEFQVVGTLANVVGKVHGGREQKGLALRRNYAELGNEGSQKSKPGQKVPTDKHD